jgi:hypothetical protein
LCRVKNILGTYSEHIFDSTQAPVDQLTDLFENIFHTFLCAFRKGNGCQTTLLRLLEDWRTALDKNQYVAR